MNDVWIALGYVSCLLIGVAGGALGMLWHRGRRRRGKGGPPILDLLVSHFHPVPLAGITISERKFPFRVRADLQRGVDRLFAAGTTICHFCGVRKDFAYEGLTFSALLADDHGPAVGAPPQ